MEQFGDSEDAAETMEILSVIAMAANLMPGMSMVTMAADTTSGRHSEVAATTAQLLHKQLLKR